MAVGRTFLVQTLHLGPTGSVATFNEATLPIGGQLGQVFEQDGKFYRLCQYVHGGVDAVAGGVAYWLSRNWRSDYKVTADASDSVLLANGVAGGTLAARTVADDNKYIFIQMGGEQVVIVAASTVASDHLSGSAATDNELVRTAAGTAPVNKLVATAASTRGTTEGIANSAYVQWLPGAQM